MLKAQAGTEFLVMFSIVILVFVGAVVLYAMNIREVDSLKNKLDAKRICVQASSAITSFASAGINSSFLLVLPEYLNYQNYTIWVNAPEHIIAVNYEISGIGCSIPISAIQNSTGANFFKINKTSTIKNVDGVLTFEP